MYGIKNRNQPDISLRNAEKYFRVTTQDGVDALVLSSVISKEPLRTEHADEEIVFNGPAELCYRIACDKIEEETYSVPPGTFFDIKSNETTESMLKLEAHPAGPTVYVTKNDLANFLSDGILTRTDRRYPRYEIRKRRVDIFSGGCGEAVDNTRKQLSINTEQAKQDVREVLKWLQWGDDVGTDGKLTKGNSVFEGKEGEQFETWIYDITDRGDDPKTTDTKNFAIIALITYKCERGALQRRRGRDKQIYIKKLEMLSERFTNVDNLVVFSAGKGILRNFPYEDMAARDLGGPFLWGTNKARHYLDLMDVLADKDKFGDRYLAGFMIAEFGWSCSNRQRKLGSCWGYEFDTLVNLTGRSVSNRQSGMHRHRPQRYDSANSLFHRVLPVPGILQELFRRDSGSDPRPAIEP